MLLPKSPLHAPFYIIRFEKEDYERLYRGERLYFYQYMLKKGVFLSEPGATGSGAEGLSSSATSALSNEALEGIGSGLLQGSLGTIIELV